MGSAKFHAHKAHAHVAAKIHHARATTPNASCNTGGFYKSPATGATIDSLKPLLIEWDPTCIDSQKLDIHLLAPWYNGETTEITGWSGVSNSDGQKSVNVQPKWWNSTSQVTVQLAIVAAGLPPAMATLPAGPIFTATYTAPADGSTPPAASTDVPIEGTSKSLSPGKTAAAVIIPLLLVGLAIFAYLRYHRRKASSQSKRFSQALDKRMSTISADWKSMSAAGAHAAIRSSMAINRDSSAFSFGNIRPSIDSKDPPVAAPQMKQVRTGTGVGLRNPGAAAAIAAERASRVSRVSFADTVGRPSTDSRRTRVGLQSTYIPPVPSRKDVVSGAPSVYPDSEIEKRDSAHHVLSPRQTSGPLTLTAEDIHARIHGRLSPAPEKNDEYDEVMPALSMMRTSSTEDYLLPHPPPPTHASSLPSVLPPSPYTADSTASAFTLSAYTQQPTSPPVMTPDDMLRAYAVRKSGAPPSSFSVPSSTGSGSPKTKGRKLSIRASLGMIIRSPSLRASSPRAPSPMVISSPVPGTLVNNYSMTQNPSLTSAGMAGVGARNMGGGGPSYVVGDDDDDYESAYGGVGRAN
ncbi:hypothetical protein C0995_009315 [Termitomyces sp. Mi166|nr:hypothetical protein C0995_009315 [Termitomyces sp. Mi166\